MGLTERIARITYKPGWRIDVCLRIRANVPDSRDPSKPFPLQSRVRITPEIEAMSDAELAAWVRERLAVVETHELDEWCRLDGEMIRDPHAPAELLRGGPVEQYDNPSDGDRHLRQMGCVEPTEPSAEKIPHPFEPYGWSKGRCGYATGEDEMMCGYPPEAHVSATPIMAVVCQLAQGDALDKLTCPWEDSAGVRCERLDPHPDGAHIIGKHTIEHFRRGNGWHCEAIDTWAR